MNKVHSFLISLGHCTSLQYHGRLKLTHYAFQSETHFEHLVSNQVGKPAELKHINKRRKRN